MQGDTCSALRARAGRVLAGAVLALVLAGCFVSNGRKEEADAKADATYAQCDQLRRAGKYTTRLAAVNCAVPTVISAYQEAAYPFNDLVYISIQARRFGANKVDMGEATEAEYQHDLAELQTRIAAEDSRRREIMKYGGLPKPVAGDVLLQGLNTFSPTPTAAALPAPPKGADSGCVPVAGIRSC